MSKYKELIIQYDRIKQSLIDYIKEIVKDKGGIIEFENYFYIHEEYVEIELINLYIKNDKLYCKFRHYEDLAKDCTCIKINDFSGDTFRNLLHYLDNTYN